MSFKLDIDAWPRLAHFHFYRQFDDPFFGICVEVDCTQTFRKAKKSDESFFLLYLHKAMLAVNRTEPFRYRIEGEEVVVHDRVGASPTISRPDGTFGFSYMDFYEDFEEFRLHAGKEMVRVRNTTGLVPGSPNDNVVHITSVPWLSFTSVSHARKFKTGDSIPKFAFGKVTEQNGRMLMPVSVHVHHALMDGSDVAKFFERFQELLNEV